MTTTISLPSTADPTTADPTPNAATNAAPNAALDASSPAHPARGLNYDLDRDARLERRYEVEHLVHVSLLLLGELLLTALVARTGGAPGPWVAAVMLIPVSFVAVDVVRTSAKLWRHTPGNESPR